MNGKNIAYIRVSTVEQETARQSEIMKKYNIDKTFMEKVSAKDTNREKLKELLEFVREGDTVYIVDFSRLARNVKDLLEIVEIFNNKGVKLVSIKENLDTHTPQGKLMLTMLGAIYEFERAIILERQREGIAIAKSKGVYKGRKKIQKPDNWTEVYEKWKNRKITGKQAMKELNLKPNIFYKFVKEEPILM